MTTFEKDRLRRMAEEPANPECRDYPPAEDSFISAMTDMPWYPPYAAEAAHYHNCMEIGLCLSGTGIVEMGGFRRRFEGGTLLVVPRGVRHAQHNAGDPYTRWRYIALDVERLLSECPPACRELIHGALFGMWSDGLYLDPADEVAAQGAGIIESMFARRRDDAAGQAQIEALALVLLTVLAHRRDFEDENKEEYPPYAAQPVEQALLYVSRHYAQEIRMEDLARSCAMSESHFRRLFTQIMGCAPLEYVNRYRVHRSLSLLRMTCEPVQNIAERVGFVSVATFNRNFRRYIGKNASQWRKECMKPQL